MEFGAIHVAAGGFLLLLALAVVWLAYRLKRKNQQLRRALAELQRRAKEPAPIIPAERPAPVEKLPEQTPMLSAQTVDAFLWQHLGDAFLWQHLADAQTAPVEITRSDSHSLPTGMCDRGVLEPLLQRDFAFTGLVVLVGITSSRLPRQEHPAQPFIEELLDPSDFACRNSDDEFLIVCPGLRDAEAQRRLNGISERLWTLPAARAGQLLSPVQLGRHWRREWTTRRSHPVRYRAHAADQTQSSGALQT